MKYFRVNIFFSIFGLIVAHHCYSQTSRQEEQDGTLSFVGSKLTYISDHGDTLSSIQFKSEIKHFIRFNKSQLSVQTTTSSHLISIVQDQLVLDESRTPDVEPNTPNWFLLFNGSKQLFLDYSGPTFLLEYSKSKSQAKPGRIWHPLEYISDSTEIDHKNVVFDIENQILFFSFPGTQSFVSVSFKTDHVQTNYIQNENSVPEACCANWFYDAVKKQVILFLKNGRKRNEYHAFAFQNGIPKADKKVGMSYYHTKDWYELGLYRGKFNSLPEYIEGNNLFKNEKKYGRLDLQAK